MESKRKITRREFLRATALAAGGAALAACTTPTPTAAPATTVPPTAVPPTAVPPTAVPAPRFKDAPMLADLVKAGTLPPVDQRLPKNPGVMVGYEGVGKYG